MVLDIVTPRTCARGKVMNRSVLFLSVYPSVIIVVVVHRK